jgi:hypothetical protein
MGRPAKASKIINQAIDWCASYIYLCRIIKGCNISVGQRTSISASVAINLLYVIRAFPMAVKFFLTAARPAPLFHYQVSHMKQKNNKKSQQNTVDLINQQQHPLALTLRATVRTTFRVRATCTMWATFAVRSTITDWSACTLRATVWIPFRT